MSSRANTASAAVSLPATSFDLLASQGLQSCAPVVRQLCKPCHDLLAQVYGLQASNVGKKFNEISNSTKLRHPATWDHVRIAADYGCLICAIFTRHPDNTLDTGAVPSQRFFRLDHTGNLSLFLDSKRPIPDTVSITKGETHSTNSVLPRSTCSKETIQQAKRWLELCDREHKACRNHAQHGGSLPTRLLHVSRSVEGDLSLHVQSTQDLDSLTTRYLVLSHCWGREQVSVVTTKANIEKFCDSIPLHLLSPLFRHALIATLELGASYIWIDSLCIVQDSLEDKGIEIPRMAQIYGNAYCSLAATGFEDGSLGMFTQSSIKGVIAEAETNMGEKLRLWPQWHQRAQWQRNIDKAPLTKRGWGFQERYLATRTLHFAVDELLWQCKSNIASESFPTKMGIHDYYHVELFDAINSWVYLIELFTATQLRFTSDTLPAVAGIATHFSEHVRGKYMAGTWITDKPAEIFWQLAWRVPPGKRASLPPDTASYRAPSWSWASLDSPALKWGNSWIFPMEPDGTVHGEGPPPLALARILGCNGIAGIFGIYRTDIDATLRLRAPLWQIEKIHAVEGRRHKDKVRYYTRLANGQEIKVYLDLPERHRTVQSFTGLWALPMVSSNLLGITGLILEPTITDSAGRYRRVGLWRYKGKKATGSLDVGEVVWKALHGELDKQAQPSSEFTRDIGISDAWAALAPAQSSKHESDFTEWTQQHLEALVTDWKIQKIHDIVLV